MTEYQVQTNVYNGPMDLLLYLIRREEVDIYDIPVAHITEQYCRYVETLHAIDPNIAGDFLVLATVLMELKSRMLLPRPTAASNDEEDFSDPRLELVRQLLEYKRFKDASFELSAAAEIQAMRQPRVPVKIKTKNAAEVDLEEVQIWDLVAAFNKLMSEIGAGAVTHDVIFDDTPISLHAEDMMDRLQSEGGQMSFREIFSGRTKPEMIGLFLAMLELMRQRRLKVTQATTGGDIHITLLSAEPIHIGDEWGDDSSSDAENWASRADERPLSSETTEEIGDRVVEPENDADEQEAELVESPDPEDWDTDEDAESFAELDQIKTEVDVDAILKEQARSTSDDTEREDDDT